MPKGFSRHNAEFRLHVCIFYFRRILNPEIDCPYQILQKMITRWPVVNFNRLHLIAFWSVLYVAYFETCSINSKIIQYRQNYKSSIFATAIPTYAQNWYVDEFWRTSSRTYISFRT